MRQFHGSLESISVLFEQDLQTMKIGSIPSRNRIWRALVEYRTSNPAPVDSQHYLQYAAVDPLHGSPPGGASGQDGIDYSLGGDRARMTSSSGAGPTVDGRPTRVYQDVMRLTLRHKVLLKEEDHNYC